MMESFSWSTPSPHVPSSHSHHPPWHPPAPPSCQRCRMEEHDMGLTKLPCLRLLTCGRGAAALPQSSSRWRLAAFVMTLPCVSILIAMAIMGMTLTGIGFVPCHTTAVYVEQSICGKGDHQYQCLQSYRTVEWELTDYKTHSLMVRSDRIHETSCPWSGVETPECNMTSPLLLAEAMSWLNVNQTCWIDVDTGSLRRSSTIAAADDERKKGSPLPYLGGLAAALVVSILICGLWVQTNRLPHLYDERISDTREHRHCYHTPEYLTLATFLMGFHHRCGGPTLQALKNNPHYDANVTHLICSFVDESVPPRVDGDCRIYNDEQSQTRIDIMSDENDCDAEDDHDDDSGTGDMTSPIIPGHDLKRSETVELLPCGTMHLPSLASIHVANLNRAFSLDSN